VQPEVSEVTAREICPLFSKQIIISYH